jgi:hypothetical protein
MFILRDDTNARALWVFLKANWLAMARAGKPVSVTVQEHKAKRTDAQNRLYWSLLHAIAKTAWVDGKQFEAEAWHEHFKREFIGCTELPSGELAGISTTTLSVTDFIDYIERVRHHAADELGLEEQHG